MIKSARISFVILGILLASQVFAENSKVKQIVDAKYYDTLVKKGVVSESRDDGAKGFRLLPESIYNDKINASAITKIEKDYPYTYEALYLLSKDFLLSNGKSGKTDITVDDVAKVARSVSKMEGMQYYSSTRKKQTTLYKNVYMIPGPKDKTRIADQNTGNADGQISYCIQEDTSFGTFTYKLSYSQKNDTLLAQFLSIDKVGIGPIKAISPENLIINILVIDCGDDILLYLNTDLDSVKFPGIKAQVNESMAARMDAIYKWFITQF